MGEESSLETHEADGQDPCQTKLQRREEDKVSYLKLAAAWRGTISTFSSLVTLGILQVKPRAHERLANAKQSSCF